MTCNNNNNNTGMQDYPTHLSSPKFDTRRQLEIDNEILPNLNAIFCYTLHVHSMFTATTLSHMRFYAVAVA